MGHVTYKLFIDTDVFKNAVFGANSQYPVNINKTLITINRSGRNPDHGFKVNIIAIK